MREEVALRLFPPMEWASRKLTSTISTPQEDPTEYAIDRMVDYDPDFGCKIRWYGYSPAEDTWEPPQNLPKNIVLQHFSRRSTPVPHELCYAKFAK